MASIAQLAPSRLSGALPIAPPAIIRVKGSDTDRGVVDIELPRSRAEASNAITNQREKFAGLMVFSPKSLASKHTGSNADYGTQVSTAAWSRALQQGAGRPEIRP